MIQDFYPYDTSIWCSNASHILLGISAIVVLNSGFLHIINLYLLTFFIN